MIAHRDFDGGVGTSGCQRIRMAGTDATGGRDGEVHRRVKEYKAIVVKGAFGVLKAIAPANKTRVALHRPGTQRATGVKHHAPQQSSRNGSSERG